MTIACVTAEQFFDTIEALVKRGLCFEACADSWSIKLTGGY